MRYFNKEKDTFLKVINALLIIGAILSVVIMVATGIQLLNKNKVKSRRAVQVCFSLARALSMLGEWQ